MYAWMSAPGETGPAPVEQWPFSGWGEIFGDEITAAAMIDRLVHHAEILAVEGDSYRLEDRDLARPARDE